MTSCQRRLADCPGASAVAYRESLRRYREEVWHVSRQALLTAVSEATATSPVVVLHDFCPESGDEILVFRLGSRPVTRPPRG